jgi:glycyl-tRNA synthetase beta chain
MPSAIGFARSHQVDVKQLSKKMTEKGERLVFKTTLEGKSSQTLLLPFLSKIIMQLPIKKSMRWGGSDFQFIRPIHWIVALLGAKILPVNTMGLIANQKTFGHRFHAPSPILLQHANEYESSLLSAKVITCFKKRKSTIQKQIHQIASNINAKACISENLLNEVTALVEWPIALLGRIEASFLTLPSEVLITSMEKHQKYFHLVNDKNQLLPFFITVSNIQSRDPQTIIQGNEKVIRSRLSDAQFFYKKDQQIPLIHHLERLKKSVFQHQLGTLFDKTQRVKKLSLIFLELFKKNEKKFFQTIDKKELALASDLSRCDLMSDMVDEFSDLQGIMGSYYAVHQKVPLAVSNALAEIYLPRFSGDDLPQTAIGLILALADRVDTLVGIFGVGIHPSSTKDPFALRRSTIGVLRLLIENQLTIDLSTLIDASLSTFSLDLNNNVKSTLLTFFVARSQAYYQSLGFSSSMIHSVHSLRSQEPFDIHQRLIALKAFLQHKNSQNLIIANKRVNNILEQSSWDKKENRLNLSLFGKDEHLLWNVIQEKKALLTLLLKEKNYTEIFNQLIAMKNSIDSFFDHVMIHVDDVHIKNNRLALLHELQKLLICIAELSLLSS